MCSVTDLTAKSVDVNQKELCACFQVYKCSIHSGPVSKLQSCPKAKVWAFSSTNSFKHGFNNIEKLK